MNAAKVALLLLAAIGCKAAPSADECQLVAKRLPSKNLHEIYGKWVLIWGVSDLDVSQDLKGNLTSSRVEFKLLADNKTIEYIERNKFTNACTTVTINMTIPSDNAEHHTLNCQSIRVEKDGVAQEHNETGEVYFYESCSNCLLMIYRAPTSKFLLSYKREGSHREVEQHKAAHSYHKRLAECVGIPHHKSFTYDGLTDICDKKSAPEVTLEQPQVE